MISLLGIFFFLYMLDCVLFYVAVAEHGIIFEANENITTLYQQHEYLPAISKIVVGIAACGVLYALGKINYAASIVYVGLVILVVLMIYINALYWYNGWV